MIYALPGNSVTRGRFAIDLTGDKELLRLFNVLPDRVQSRVMRGAVAKVARRMVRVMKETIENVGAVETGTLKKSIGFKVSTTRTGIVAYIGPRRGFRRPVAKNKKGQVKTLGKKGLAAAEAAGGKVEYREPARYAHLVEFGTDDTRPNPFMRISFQESQDMAAGVLRRDILIGVKREAAKLAKGRRRG